MTAKEHIERFIAQLKSDGLKSSTIDNYSACAWRFFEWVELKKLPDADSVENYVKLYLVSLHPESRKAARPPLKRLVESMEFGGKPVGGMEFGSDETRLVDQFAKLLREYTKKIKIEDTGPLNREINTLKMRLEKSEREAARYKEQAETATSEAQSLRVSVEQMSKNVTFLSNETHKAQDFIHWLCALVGLKEPTEADLKKRVESAVNKSPDANVGELVAAYVQLNNDLKQQLKDTQAQYLEAAKNNAKLEREMSWFSILTEQCIELDRQHMKSDSRAFFHVRNAIHDILIRMGKVCAGGSSTSPGTRSGGDAGASIAS